MALRSLSGNIRSIDQDRKKGGPMTFTWYGTAGRKTQMDKNGGTMSDGSKSLVGQSWRSKRILAIWIVGNARASKEAYDVLFVNEYLMEVLHNIRSLNTLVVKYSAAYLCSVRAKKTIKHYGVLQMQRILGKDVSETNSFSIKHPYEPNYCV